MSVGKLEDKYPSGGTTLSNVLHSLLGISSGNELQLFTAEHCLFCTLY